MGLLAVNAVPTVDTFFVCHKSFNSLKFLSNNSNIHLKDEPVQNDIMRRFILEHIFSLDSDVIPVKIIVDKDADFTDPIELMLGRKNGLFSLDPISIMPEEKEKHREL